MEFPAGKVISQGGAINHPRFSPRGDRIAFFDYPSHINADGKVVVVDLEGHKILQSKGWADLTGLAWSADGNEVWFTGNENNGAVELFAVDLKGNVRVVEKIPGDLIIYDIDHDGRALLGREEWRGGVYGLGAGETSEKNLSWFCFSFAEDISADGKYVLLGEEGESAGGVVSYLRRMDGSPAVRLYDEFCNAISQKADYVICSGSDQQLHLVPTGTGEAMVNDQESRSIRRPLRVLNI